jgi:hypothetical protein
LILNLLEGADEAASAVAERQKPAVKRRFGFAILAIDCLLIETLAAFVEGLETTDGKSKATFCTFLTTRPKFKATFTFDIAKQFYEEFRCGILHQAVKTLRG